jgi:hypothetical protein
METMIKLLYLIDGGAPQWRIDLTARLVVMKVVLMLPVCDLSRRLLDLWD